MIRSLYNLTRAINTHIDRIPVNKDFSLLDIKPINRKIYDVINYFNNKPIYGMLWIQRKIYKNKNDL